MFQPTRSSPLPAIRINLDEQNSKCFSYPWFPNCVEERLWNQNCANEEDIICLAVILTNLLCQCGAIHSWTCWIVDNAMVGWNSTRSQVSAQKTMRKYCQRKSKIAVVESILKSQIEIVGSRIISLVSPSDQPITFFQVPPWPPDVNWLHIRCSKDILDLHFLCPGEKYYDNDDSIWLTFVILGFHFRVSF